MATYNLEYLNEFRSMPATLQTLMAATFETTSPECLRDYGITQFIRGCIYSTRVEKDGSISKYYKMRESRGTLAKFKHSVWEVDSVDVDPLYSSYSGPDASPENRHDWYTYGKGALLLKDDHESLMLDKDYYFVAKNKGYLMNAPAYNTHAIITDTPSGSAFIPDAGAGAYEIETSSLEFVACIYRTKDVPMVGSPVDFDGSEEEGGPISCFSWSDKSKFNQETKRFERTEKLDPFCFEE